MAHSMLWLLLVPFIFGEPTPSRTVVPHPGPSQPVPPEKLEQVIARGADYLCRSQNADGSWGSPRWTGGVDHDPVPGAFHSFGTATTALCLEALLGAGDTPRIRQ